MDNKLTLSLDENVIRRAKEYAAGNHISLSRLIEFLLNKVTSSEYNSLENLPVSDWVNMVAEGETEYQTKRNRKSSRKAFYDSK
ncbi:MAG TPA: DUF6364 family protein [Chitinophagaceae bacterium]